MTVRMCERGCGHPALPMRVACWDCTYRAPTPVSEAAKARRRAYDRSRSPEAERERHQQWRAANRETERETDRSRYAADPGKISRKIAARRAAEISCAALSGQWYLGVLTSTNNGPNDYQYFDLQDVRGPPQTFTGMYVNYAPPCAAVNVNGTMNTNGTFDFTIGPYPAAPGCGGGITETGTGVFPSGYSCSEITIQFTSGGGPQGLHRASCPVPNSKGGPVSGGEGQTTFVIWGPSGPPAYGSLGVAEYQTYIKPPMNVITGQAYPYFNYSGRSIEEGFSNFVPTCVPYGIPTPTPSDPFVLPSGNEYYDYVGFPAQGVPNKVRLRDAVPCNLTFQQTMTIDCNTAYGNGPAVAYQTNPMLLQVNASTVTVQRNSVNPNPLDSTFWEYAGSTADVGQPNRPSILMTSLARCESRGRSR